MQFNDIIKRIKSQPTADWWWDIDYDVKKKWAGKAWQYIEQLSSVLNIDGAVIKTHQQVFWLMEDLSGTANSNENPAPNDFEIEEICECLRNHYNAISGDDEDTRKSRLSMINIGVRVLGKCNNPAALETLLLFVRPNVENVLEERVTEFSMDSIKELVVYGSERHREQEFRKRNPFILPQDIKELVLDAMIEGHLNDNREEVEIYCDCGHIARELPTSECEQDVFEEDEPEECSICEYYLDGTYHYCDSCSMKICNSICIENSQLPLFNRQKALKIMRYLNDEIVIEHVLKFLESEYTSEIAVALQTLNDHWKDEYMQHVEFQAEKGDASYPTDVAIRILGKRGGEEHVPPLIDQLRAYSKLDGKGFRDSRDVVEGALVNLRTHSKQTLELISAEDNNAKGFQKSIKRVLKKISEAENEKPRAPYTWRGELHSWRKETAKKEKVEPFKILWDDHLFKIYNRQPLTYEELMDFEIGAYKVNKYGSEILAIVRKNQPNIAEEDVAMGPWQLPIIVRDLLEKHLNVVDWPFEEWDDDANSAMMKGLDAHTKGQLRKLSKSENPSFDEDIVERVLDMVIKTMEIEGVLVKAGQRRGVRYALLNRD
tara:strand:+ start:152 stop:1957 length:1806 start_codon:yes stop_codon:yes gene_type:complete